MNITTENYEVYFMDYCEGLLNSEQLAELGLFLSLNPELKIQLQLTKNIILPYEICEYPNKSLLKKFEFQTTPITDHTINDFCIAYHEGLLLPNKKLEVHEFCHENKSRERIFNQFGIVYVKPQTGFKFQAKENLYRKHEIKLPGSYRLIHYALLVAGIELIILIGINIFQKRNIDSTSPIINPLSVKIPRYNNTSITLAQIKKQKEYQTIKPIIATKKHPGLKNFVYDTPIKKNLSHVEELSLSLLNPSKHTLIPYAKNFKLKNYMSNIENSPKNQPIDKTLITSVGKFLGKIKLNNPNKIKDFKEKLTLFKICKAGINGFNYLTDSNMQLTETSDSTGRISAFSFEAGIIKIQQMRNY